MALIPVGLGFVVRVLDEASEASPEVATVSGSRWIVAMPAA